MFSKRNYSISVEYLEDIYFSSEQVRNVSYVLSTHGDAGSWVSQELWFPELLSLAPGHIEAHKQCQRSAWGKKLGENQQWEAAFLAG